MLLHRDRVEARVAVGFATQPILGHCVANFSMIYIRTSGLKYSYLPVRAGLVIRKANQLSTLLALHLACGAGMSTPSGYLNGIISGRLRRAHALPQHNKHYQSWPNCITFRPHHINVNQLYIYIFWCSFVCDSH